VEWIDQTLAYLAESVKRLGSVVCVSLPPWFV
jgi:hypothetical protein